MFDDLMNQVATRAQIFVREFKRKGVEMVKRAEELKREGEEELKSEREKEEQERRMGELEE